MKRQNTSGQESAFLGHSAFALRKVKAQRLYTHISPLNVKSALNALLSLNSPVPMGLHEKRNEYEANYGRAPNNKHFFFANFK